MAWIWFAAVAIVISKDFFKVRFLAVSHWLERLTGLALIVLGFRLALAEANE